MLIIVGNKRWKATIRQIINYEKKLAVKDDTIQQQRMLINDLEKENSLLKKMPKTAKIFNEGVRKC